MKQIKQLIRVFLILVLIGNTVACGTAPEKTSQKTPNIKYVVSDKQEEISIDEIPEYDGEPYVEVENNDPDFSEEEMQTEAYEYYSELDGEGKCGVVEANIGEELMPVEERGAIGQVKPTGWHTVKYDIVDGKYLYNRCHLIGYQLTGENANEKNLITGTRYMNVEGMLPFENMVADYIRETGNHVLYRVTPIYEDDDLLALGVQIEAESIEDEGEGVCFNVFVYNVQPGIEIDYSTGESRYIGLPEENTESEDVTGTFVLNTNSMKYHDPSCSGAKRTKPENKKNYTGNISKIEKQGYEPCGMCQ